MKAFAEAGWKFEDAIIGHQNHDVSGRIEHRRAYLTRLQVPVNLGAELRIYIVLDVGRDVLPDVFAVDSHLRPPNQLRFAGANPFNCGARLR